MRRLIPILVLVACAVIAPSADASFGLEKFDVTYTNADGSPATQAGSHPFQMRTSVYFNLKPGGQPDQEVNDFTAEQMAGLVGDPGAVPRCSTADFLTLTFNVSSSSCPDSTVVGYDVSDSTGGVALDDPVYNLVPPPGVVSKIGFIALDTPVTIEVGLSHNYPYNISAVVTNLPQSVGIRKTVLTLWGDPADPAHDQFRGKCIQPGGGPKEVIAAHFPDPPSYGECHTDSPNVPFLTLPRACSGPLASGYVTDSWQDPGAVLSGGEPDLGDPAWVTGSVLTHDSGEPVLPLGMTGCSRLGFDPSVGAQPTSVASQSPTGLDFALNVHDEGLTSPAGLAQSDIRKTVVTLPEGMTANPSLAEGLNVCSEADLARETAGSLPGEGCPNESKIGTIEVETPLLEEPLKGSLYIATPHANPFNSLLALYFVIKSPTLGIIIKQPALVEPNPVTGQLVTTVENIPQLPFSHFKLHFREGARSPLVTPPACGTYNASAVLTPWSGGPPVTSTSMFQVIAGTGGGACPAGGVAPFAPQVITGTLSNNAGAYSPFDLRITRNDGEQELTRFSTTLAPGLSGSLTGIPFCPDAAIEAARGKTGAQEQAEPSCPAASEIGHTLVGAGVGGVLAWAPGKVYLAGPYNGASMSVVSITSAEVGPFDLGTVVVRFALRINPITAQVELSAAGSDPIPHIIDGIVVNVRDIRAYIDREKFTLNPTSCNPLSIENTVSGAGADFTSPADDVPVTLNSPFQAADCGNLKYTPKLAVATAGHASKANGAGLSFKISYPTGALGTQSWFNEAKFDLPKQLPARLTTIQQACLAATFETNRGACPAHSIIGHTVVHTPVLPVPLEGPVYFVSYGGAKFPEAVMVLDGYGIHIELHGETFIAKSGLTSATFRNTPDVPFESIEVNIPTGPFSEFGANLPAKDNYNLCGQKLVMPTLFKAQNGLEIHQNTAIAVTGCPKPKALTRAQKLAAALKACKKKAKSKRPACTHAAHKKYSTATNTKRKKK